MLDLDALEQRIEQAMQSCCVPGLSICIVKGREVAYARGFGVTGVEDHTAPVTPQTVFRIGSMTKLLTTVAIMRLVEAGTLDLDRAITAYLPGLRLRNPGAAEQITLRMLLSHSAGLPERSLMRQGRRDPEGLELEMREDLPRYPLVAAPGSLWSYSTLGFNLAGYIAQVAADTPFAQLMQSLVFDPLEMRRATFDPTVAATYPHAQLVGEAADGSLYVYHDGGDNTANYPGAFAFASVLDLANFTIMSMHGGGFGATQVLSVPSLAQIQTPRANLYVDTGLSYGLGMYVEPPYKGIRRIGHEGTLPGAAGKLVMAPDAQLAVVVLYNRENLGGPFYPLCDSIIDSIFDQMLLLPAEEAPRATAEPEHSAWTQYAGDYSRAFAMSRVTVAVEDGRLMLCNDRERVALEPRSNGLYVARLPGGQPGFWPRTPYRASPNLSVGFLAAPRQPVPYLSINTNVHKRIAS